MLVKERDIACFCGGFSFALVVGMLLLVLAFGSVSCTASRPGAPTALPVVPNLALVQRLDSAALAGRLPTDLRSLPAYLVPPPPGSTARQRRQWQKAQAQNLALSGILPAKIKNSSVATAPGATAINRPTAPVATQGSTATDARKAGQRQGTLAVGPGAVATSTQEYAGVPWWVFVLVAVGGAVGWEWLTSHFVPLAWLPWRPKMG
jgi:hypothetical protein